MAAIITENYRKAIAKLLKENLQNSNNAYYVGIGKSDEWYEDLSGGLTAPFPKGTSGDSLNVLSNLTDLIRVGADKFSRVIPNVNPITVASYYKKFDAYDASCLYPSTVGDIQYKPAYFIEPTNGGVFLVIDAPTIPAPLSIPPDNDFFLNGNFGQLENGFIPEIGTFDGYTIVFIGSINPNSQFNNTQFVEVRDTTLSGDHNYKGALYGFHVANGGEYIGSGNSVTGTVTVYEYGASNSDPTQALSVNVLCTISDGKVTSVKPTSSYYANLANGSLDDFSFNKPTAVLTITGSGITTTTAATLYPCVSNPNGFKYDMTEYTPAWYVCFITNSDLSPQNVYTSYSQVSLIRNPILSGASTVLNVEAKDMKRSFTLIDYTLSSSIDNTYSIVQKNSLGTITRRIGTVDSYIQDGDNLIVYYTSSAKYGYDSPTTTAANTISFIDSSNVATNTATVPSSLVNTAVDSADVLFIDNRGTINRAADQNEELKIIIQL